MAVSFVSSSGVETYAASGGVPSRGGGGVVLPPAGTILPGDLLIAVIGSSKQYASVSTGWTQVASIGSGASWLAAFKRVADGSSNDTITVALSASGSYAMGMCALRAPLGFDAASVESTQQNCTTGAGASYALGTTLSGVGTGEFSIALGGNHGTTSYTDNNTTVSGASWTLENEGGHGGAPGASAPGGCNGCFVPDYGNSCDSFCGVRRYHPHVRAVHLWRRA